MKKREVESSVKAPKPFNPLEKLRLAESIVRELLDAPDHPLPPEEKFIGAGIYVIYYIGKFKAYQVLSESNQQSLLSPIYVGKAITPGGRKGGFSDRSGSAALFSRLNQHATSIVSAVNLSIEDFSCRYLVVDEFWISLAESLLIELYQPIWNVVVDGFGNHDPGAGRTGGTKSNWDVLHPGRKWSDKLHPGRLTEKSIEQLAIEHLAHFKSKSPQLIK